MIIVPHHNSPDVVVGLLRGDVQMVVDFAPALQGQINSKQLRVLATSGAARASSSPNVPTVAEAGVPGYEVTSWNGLFAPKGTPKEVIETMNKAMAEVLAMPDVKAQFEKVGVEAHASTPSELIESGHYRHQEMGNGHGRDRDGEEVRGRARAAPRLVHRRQCGRALPVLPPVEL